MSKYWKRKRDEALEYFGHQCIQCGSGDALQVHHENYRNLWSEELGVDITVLCHPCHADEHGVEMHDDADLVEVLD